MSKKEVKNFLVEEIRFFNRSTFLLKLKSNECLPEFLPGQFVNIEIPDQSDVFLRRPFSVFEIDNLNNTVSLIIKVLGKGSKKLSEINVGDELNLVFPLGNGFTQPDANDLILLIGGGSGLAPMLFLAKNSGIPKSKVHVIIGARSKDEHIFLDEYSRYGEFFFTTEDGSFGEKGYVTHHTLFLDSLKEYSKIYACGPLGMMKAIAAQAKNHNVFCEVSLENLMACGFGVCLCCIEPTIKGNQCVCTEGPVFNVKELKW